MKPVTFEDIKLLFRDEALKDVENYYKDIFKNSDTPVEPSEEQKVDKNLPMNAITKLIDQQNKEKRELPMTTIKKLIDQEPYLKNDKSIDWSNHVKLSLIQDDDLLIFSIKNPSELLLKKHLLRNKRDFKYLELSDEMKKFVIDYNPEAIMEMKNPSKELVDYALSKNISLINNIDEPTLDQIKLAIEKGTMLYSKVCEILYYNDFETYKKAVLRNNILICYSRKYIWTDEMKKFMEENPELILEFKNIDDEDDIKDYKKYLLMAIKKTPGACSWANVKSKFNTDFYIDIIKDNIYPLNDNIKGEIFRHIWTHDNNFSVEELISRLPHCYKHSVETFFTQIKYEVLLEILCADYSLIKHIRPNKMGVIATISRYGKEITMDELQWDIVKHATKNKDEKLFNIMEENLTRKMKWYYKMNT